MRRRATPIGWPRRNPRHYRFAVPNAVWEYKLKPVEFTIFSYLCYRRAPSALTPEIIAAGVHMTASTVKKYLETLVDKELVTAERSLALDVQCITSEKFFTLPNEVYEALIEFSVQLLTVF